MDRLLEKLADIRDRQLFQRKDQKPRFAMGCGNSYNVNEEHSCAADNVFGYAGCNLSLRNNETLTFDAIERTHGPFIDKITQLSASNDPR